MENSKETKMTSWISVRCLLDEEKNSRSSIFPLYNNFVCHLVYHDMVLV